MSTVESKFASFQLVGKVANPKCTYALTVDSAEDAKAESPDNSVIKASYSLLLKSTESAKFFERVFGELMAGFEALSPYVFNKCSVDVQDTVLTATLRINVRDVYAKFVEQAEKIFNDIKGAEVVFKFGSTLDDYVDPARDVKDLLQAEVTINGQPALVDKAVEFTVKHVNRSLQRANDKWELTPATADDGSTVINSEQVSHWSHSSCYDHSSICGLNLLQNAYRFIPFLSSFFTNRSLFLLSSSPLLSLPLLFLPSSPPPFPTYERMNE